MTSATQPHRVAIHAHCYQPPREDPFTGQVPVEPSAAPFHDWNARIVDECYAPLAQARDLDGQMRVNLFEWLSFNVSPTLATWLERHASHVLQAMVAGDAAAVRRTGHGNAIATPYHHVILPLASPREREREIAWGLHDFRARFGREPLGFWCPETAIDDATAAALHDAGVRFTLIAPTQLHGGAQATTPVTWRDGHGRSLVLVPYDGPVSGAIGFTNLAQDGAALADALARSAAVHGATSVATDGETFGHHKRHGEMGLAAAIGILRRSGAATVVGTEALVASADVWPDAHLVSPSAWSCAHGVERWRSNCGCRADHGRHPQQQWRAPLRHALRWLADALDQGADFLDADLPARDARSARYAMFTSCGWFFDDFEGHETRILLRFAARAIVGHPHAAALSEGVAERLAIVEPADRSLGTGADIWRRDYAPLALG